MMLTMKRYRCIFWGFFFSVFTVNLFGILLLPGFIALGIFSYGIYGLYNQTEDEYFRSAGITAAIGAMLDFFTTMFAWLNIDLPAYGNYIPLCLNYVAFGCTFFALFSGMQKIFRTCGDPAIQDAARACGCSVYVLPVLYTLCIIVYGVILILSPDGSWHELRKDLIVGVSVLELAAAIYALRLIAYYKKYLKIVQYEEAEDSPQLPEHPADTGAPDCPMGDPTQKN